MAKAEAAAQEPEITCTPDPMQEMVKIKIPRDPVNKGNDSMFVAINGRKFLIQRGKTVEVPRAVAEVIEHSEEQAEEADLYISENSGS